MTDEFPPFGGENLPPRELDREKIVQNYDKTMVKKPKNFLIIGLLVIVAFLLGIITLLLVMPKEEKVVLVIPSPSPQELLPSPAATQSGLPINISQRLQSLQTSLQNVDFNQTQFLFPIVDFEIVFEKDN